MDKDTPRYIREHFLTLKQLCEKSTVTGEEILQLIEKKCIPKHSYEITETTEVQSFFGKRTALRSTTQFYAKSNLDRIREVTKEARTQNLEAIACTVKERFLETYRRQISAAEEDLPGIMDGVAVEKLLQEEWQAWLDGIYGLCTIGATADDVAAKEVSIRRIRRITDDATKSTLTPLEGKHLQEAVNLLNEAASLFAPDERADSSRERWINRIVDQYELIHPTIPSM
ncbi:MAG: hypothetical protein K0U98_03530 [Deltaproteobacteria bacterium]|nr:hypothetical protein [Deltaproteobacteria bacterium]